jgi:hypothetical protein
MTAFNSKEESMLQPKVSTILPRAKNQPKAKTLTSNQKARPAHNLPEMLFPTSYDLKHAKITFTPCYGCNGLFPDAGLLLDCESCGARMCGECENRCRSCACKQIKRYSDKCATLMTTVTDNPPCDERYTISDDGRCSWFAL